MVPSVLQSAETHMKYCAKCATKFDWRRSDAVLKMTYCTGMCESADLLFDLAKATK